MLEFKNVSKRYGKNLALDDISFTVGDGEFVFLTGPSGAGKTTILRLIIRELAPTSGEIILDDLQIHSLKKSDIPFLRQNIGVVFQDFKLLSDRTIRENIEVGLAVKGIAKEEWGPRVDQVLQLVKLINKSELFPSQLSGGELQRASLARALVINPKIVLADEPTGNLDWKTAQEIMDLLDTIHKEGKTVVVTTHNHAIVEKMKKTVLEIDDGKIVNHTKK